MQYYQCQTFFSGILRFKYVEICKVLGILSELKDSGLISGHSSLYKPQSKEIQCISGEYIFYLHPLSVFQIQICSFVI